METSWLEDFVVLVESNNFSKAARIRHVTQPAFSRRIQNLEAWVGLELLDRSTYPPSLTKAGQHFYTQAQDLLNRIGYLRLSSNEQPGRRQETISFALPHTLSMTLFPGWLVNAERAVGAIESRLRVGNVLDAVLWLVEGGCDILFCYHHPQQPIQLDPERYEVLSLGEENLAPYSAVNKDGKPVYEWPGKPQRPVPFLAYTSNAYFGRMTDIAMRQGRTSPHLKRIFDTELSEVQRRMVLACNGISFLPGQLVAEDVKARRLVKLDGGWEVTMQIRAYRERPTIGHPARPQVERLWRWIEQESREFPQSTITSSFDKGGVNNRKTTRQSRQEKNESRQ